MGIRDDLNADIVAAFDDPDGLADAVKEGNYRLFNKSTSSYNPSTGDTNPSVTEFGVRGVFYDPASLDIINSSVDSDTAKYLILQTEWEGSRLPKIDDELEITIDNEDRVYRVAGLVKDPVDVTYILSVELK